MVVNQIKMEDEDALDLLFWQGKDVSERLQEVYRLRQSYFTWLNGSFPAKIEKVVNRRPL
ncbi:hypothetical protein D3C83_188190 [compost metagenome]